MLLALVVALFSPGAPAAIDLADRLAPPLTDGTLFGTDPLGRHVGDRLLTGLAWSVGVASGATLLSGVIGTAFGLLLISAPAWVAGGMRRLLDLSMSLPTLVLAIAVIAVLGQGFWTLVLVLGGVSWPVFARVAEAEGLKIKNQDFVLAARLYNLPEATIFVRHILPQVYPSLLVVFAFHFADMLIAESALSFLGVGAPLGTPTWGNMLAESRAYLYDAPWLMAFPAAAIVAVVVIVNLAGDYLITKVKSDGLDHE